MNGSSAALKKSDFDGFFDPFANRMSVKGRQWYLPSINESKVANLVNGYGLPEMVARLLVLRKLDNLDIESFLYPKLGKDFPDPYSLKNMDGAADMLAQALREKKIIGILADFDVDGATSCAVLKRFLKMAGQDSVPFVIPDRLEDGYGPSVKAFDELKSMGCDIVVILDSGTAAHDPIQHAKNIGLQTIVIDHHEPEGVLPVCDYIVNPKLPDDTSNLDMLAAVGVTFLFTVAVNAKLRQSGHYEVNKEPQMREFLDLVALGTVCDMVPLTGANRLFVKYGFPLMNERRNAGLKALLEVSKIHTVPDPYHAGFMLGPRINAGSRVHQSNLGAQLLSTDDEAEALRLAWLLDDCNEKRKSLQKDMTQQAMAAAKAYMTENPDAQGLVLAGEGWHSGLSGLVAGAIKDKYERPTCVIAFVETPDGQVEGRASGRSVAGVHIAEIFMAAKDAGLLVKGGGHAMAGGFTIEPEKIPAFRQFFDRKVAEQKASHNAESTTAEAVEMMMSVKSLSITTAKLLTESLSPFGMGNSEPVTVLSNVCIRYAEQVGTNHLRCTIQDSEGSTAMKAMAFRAFDADLGKALRDIAGTGRPVHLRGQVKVNEWQGRQSVEYHIEDAIIE